MEKKAKKRWNFTWACALTFSWRFFILVTDVRSQNWSALVGAFIGQLKSSFLIFHFFVWIWNLSQQQRGNSFISIQENINKHLVFKFFYSFISKEFEGGLKALIGVEKKEIALAKLIVVPSFLRFDVVSLEYRIGSQTISEKCETFRAYLLKIKAALCDSRRTGFYCKINQENPSQFADNSTLLEHIRHIVSICDSSRGYTFDFCSEDETDSDGFVNLVASIFEMSPISRSSAVCIALFPFWFRSPLTQLPVETISNWLNRERHTLCQKQRERVLILIFQVQYAQIKEMCDFLKQVFFCFRIFI